MKYSQERKESVLRKMMPPHNRSINQLAKEEGISEPTLYNWRNEARRKGILLPDGDSSPEGWTARDKFAAVRESASLNEEEIAEYCRRKGVADVLKSVYPHPTITEGIEECLRMLLDKSIFKPHAFPEHLQIWRWHSDMGAEKGPEANLAR